MVGVVNSVVFGRIAKDAGPVATGSVSPVRDLGAINTVVAGWMSNADRQHSSSATTAAGLFGLGHSDAMGSISKLPSRSLVTR